MDELNRQLSETKLAREDVALTRVTDLIDNMANPKPRSPAKEAKITAEN